MGRRESVFAGGWGFGAICALGGVAGCDSGFVQTCAFCGAAAGVWSRE